MWNIYNKKIEDTEDVFDKKHNGYDIIQRKILIGKLSIECLKLQEEYSRNIIKIQKQAIETAKKKYLLIEKQNEIFEKQLSEFTESRQQECLDINIEINLLDIHPSEYRELVSRTDDLTAKLAHLTNQIQGLEAQMPEEFMITQYKL